MDRFFEFRGNITAYGKLNSAEAGVLLFVITVCEQIMLIPCRIGAESHGLYSFGEKREGFFQYPQLFVSRWDIAVSELCMKHKPQFCPVGM